MICSEAFARLQLTDEMVHYARHDPLTDLPNRGILLDRAAQALHRARRRGVRVALLFVDLDGFKPVNDRFGHAAGDAVLVEVARRLVANTRDIDTVARLGGDEFAVLLEDVTVTEVVEISDRILASLAAGAEVAGHRVTLGASIGIAYGDGSESGEALLRHADLAMYEAKGRGKAQYVAYEPAIGQARMRRLELVDELRTAIARRDLRVVYQPVVLATTGRIAGVEALVRWQLDGADVPTDVFVRLAEETDQVGALGDLVLETVAQDALSLREAAGGPISISVNVSARQLQEPTFVTTRGADGRGRWGAPGWCSRSPNGRRSPTARHGRRCGSSPSWACGSRSTTSGSASPRSATCATCRCTSSRPTPRWPRRSTATSAPAPSSGRSP